MFETATIQDDRALRSFPGSEGDWGGGVFFKLDFLGCQEVVFSCDL